jgi:hypothetical protein
MAAPVALTLALALAAGPGGDRILLCRPKVTGDAALARGDAVVEAARRAGRFLDYGVPCEDPAESARAARRVGLAHAVSATADGRVDGSRYLLVLSDAATEAERARRAIEVAPGADGVTPLRGALSELLGTLPRPPGPRYPHLGAWTTVGAGVAALAAGVVLAGSARAAADAAGAATDAATYTRERDRFGSRRTASGAALGIGAAAVAGGLAWRFAF